MLFPLHCLLPGELRAKEVEQKHRLVNSVPSPGAPYKSGKTPSIPNVLFNISEEGRPGAGDRGHTLKETDGQYLAGENHTVGCSCYSQGQDCCLGGPREDIHLVLHLVWTKALQVTVRDLLFL